MASSSRRFPSVILLDADEPGRKHAALVAGSLLAGAKEVRLVELPRLPEKGDVSDWLDDGHATNELQQLMDQARAWRQGETSTSTTLPSFHYTDLGNAQRLVHQHGQDVRYCRKLTTWFVWDGRRWQPDTTGEIFRRAKQTVASMLFGAIARLRRYACSASS